MKNPQDGGRIVTALSPWLWLVGAAMTVALLVLHPNFLVGLILLVSLPRLWILFRKKSDEQRRCFEVTPGRRLAMAGRYFGLIVFLLLGMAFTHTVPPSQLYAPKLHVGAHRNCCFEDSRPAVDLAIWVNS